MTVSAEAISGKDRGACRPRRVRPAWRPVSRTGRFALVAVVLLMVGVMRLGAVALADEPGEPLQEKVAALISRLDASTRAERNRARRELIGLGTDVLPLLPPGDLVESAAAREALDGIRIHLERRKAVESARPSRVTLHGSLPLPELLREVTRQTGNEVDIAGLPNADAQADIAVAYHESPFWMVIDDLAARSGLEIDEQLPDGRVRFVLPEPSVRNPELAVVNDRSIRVSLLSATQRKAFVRDDGQLLRLRLSVTAEPRLRPLFLRYSGRDLELADASGRSLPPVSPDAKLELPFGRSGKHLQVQSDFLMADDTPLSQATLSGRFSVELAAGAEAISFRDLSKSQGAVRRRGGVIATLRKVQVENGDADRRDLQVEVGVSYETGGPAFESHRLWVFQNEAYIETPAGRRLNPASAPEPRQQADGAVVVRYTFGAVDADLAQCRFMYVAPTLITSLPVEFEFSDIPVTPHTIERSPK